MPVKSMLVPLVVACVVPCVSGCDRSAGVTDASGNPPALMPVTVPEPWMVMGMILSG